MTTSLAWLRSRLMSGATRTPHYPPCLSAVCRYCFVIELVSEATRKLFRHSAKTARAIENEASGHSITKTSGHSITKIRTLPDRNRDALGQPTTQNRTLIDRNSETIRMHRFALFSEDDIDKQTRSCIAQIAQIEGQSRLIPAVSEELCDWEARSPKEWIELKHHVLDVMQVRVTELQHQREAQERRIAERAQEQVQRASFWREQTENVERPRRELWASSEDVIRRFLEIAERNTRWLTIMGMRIGTRFRRKWKNVS